MQQQLINRSPDLQRLRDEGYHILIEDGYAVLRGVPYVAQGPRVAVGSLATKLNISGERTAKPATHVTSFSGSEPCDYKGKPFATIINGTDSTRIGSTDYCFRLSAKPPNGYQDYYELFTTYVDRLQGHAQQLDGSVTSRTYPPIEDVDENSVFRYVDTASSRSGITDLMTPFLDKRVVIVGVGGTGAYVLDLVAKTPVKHIRIIDGDVLLNHNAWRMPGAASLEQLNDRPFKVEYLRQKYDPMRRGIDAVGEYLDASNLSLLDDADFVFMCIDDGEAKKRIFDHLEAATTPFVDVGIGVSRRDDGLAGQVRTTAAFGVGRDWEQARTRVSLGQAIYEEAYRDNVQIAELNALNAVLAVVRWKKHWGFYADLERERTSIYEIDGNTLINQDQDDIEAA